MPLDRWGPETTHMQSAKPAQASTADVKCRNDVCVCMHACDDVYVHEDTSAYLYGYSYMCVCARFRMKECMRMYVCV